MEHADLATFETLPELKPIYGLLMDDTVSDILINGPDKIYIEQRGKLRSSELTFESEEQLQAMAHAIAKAVGRSMPEHRPILDARLADGSRVNVIAPPLAVDGTMVSIRKFSTIKITLDDMMKNKNISRQMGEFLKVCARCRLNMVISGGTGSGKSTLLNAISQYIESTERIVTIEDAAELRLQQPHVIRLETLPPEKEKDIEPVVARDLVRNALRMRPDRIIIGETRGNEAFDILQAMNTGHEGSMTTIHANHPRDAISRLENMIVMEGIDLPLRVTRSQISSAIHLILQVSRMRDGVRRVTHISEITGMEADVICMQDLFTFKITGESETGHIHGDFVWEGVVPRFLARVSYWGQRQRLSDALGLRMRH